MTVNEKAGELPAPVSDISDEARELIIDNYLNRRHLIRRVIACLADDGLDLSDQDGRGHFTKDALVAWHRFVFDTDETEAKRLKKAQLAADIAAHYGVQMDPDRDGGFPKTALVRVYVALATGDQPQDVATSADGKEGNTTDVPTLTDGGVPR